MGEGICGAVHVMLCGEAQWGASWRQQAAVRSGGTCWWPFCPAQRHANHMDTSGRGLARKRLTQLRLLGHIQPESVPASNRQLLQGEASFEVSRTEHLGSCSCPLVPVCGERMPLQAGLLTRPSSG